MLLKTILNRVEPFKSFVYGKARWVKDAGRKAIEVEVHTRKNGQAICSGCATCDFPYQGCTNCQFSGSTGECGHYLNMKSSVLSTVACGFSTVGWYAQDFK